MGRRAAVTSNPEMISEPTVSVIRAVLNREDFIRCAVETILSQTYPKLEYIVKDGGSADGTLDVLSTYSGKLNLISTADGGIYDALNEGIRAASGEIIAFLHADDFYATPDAVASMVRAMIEAEADVAWVDFSYVDRRNITRVLRRWKSSPYAPGEFIRGWLMLRFLEKNRIKSTYLPETIVTMRLGGVSNRPSAILGTARRETARAWQRNDLLGGTVASMLKPISKLPQLF